MVLVTALYKTDVKPLKVPLIDNLKPGALFVRWFHDGRVSPCLPDQDDLKLLPRHWVVDVLHTVLGEKFSDWVDARVKKHLAKRKRTARGIF